MVPGGELQNLLAYKTTRDKQELWQHPKALALKDSCLNPGMPFTFLALPRQLRSNSAMKFQPKWTWEQLHLKVTVWR
jgi:hypothetical protein